MLSFETAITFFFINLSLCLIPCAEMVILITQSTTQGWRSGMVFTAGICMALAIQVLLMAFGVSAIIQTSAVAFNILKVIGVCYLFFLSWQSFTQPVLSTTNTGQLSNGISLLKKGIFLTFSTPVIPLFLLVFIPPFIEADRGDVLSQSLQLGFLLITAVLCGYAIIGIGAEKIGKKILQSDNILRYLQRSAGAIIAFFAAYLALFQQ